MLNEVKLLIASRSPKIGPLIGNFVRLGLPIRANYSEAAFLSERGIS
jgi:hypothetical protein